MLKEGGEQKKLDRFVQCRRRRRRHPHPVIQHKEDNYITAVV